MVDSRQFTTVDVAGLSLKFQTEAKFVSTLVQVLGINERGKGQFNAWFESVRVAQTNMAVVVYFNLLMNTENKQ